MEEDLHTDSDLDMDSNSDSFIFSRPSPISSPEKVFNSGTHSDNIFGIRTTQQTEETAFTFAKPATIERHDLDDRNESKLTIANKKSLRNHKSISRTSPLTAAQVIKRTAAFTQLEKNSKKKEPSDIKKSIKGSNPEEKSRRKSDSKDVRLELRNSIICMDVPESLLVKSIAKEYFEDYGEILKITVKPKRKMIIVYYRTREMATKAFRNSGSYLGDKFKVEWTTPELLNKPKKKESIKGKIAAFLNVDDDDEVREELEALKGLEYNLPGQQNSMAVSAARAKVKRAAKVSAKVSANKEMPKRPVPLISKSLLKVAKPLTVSQPTAIPPLIPKIAKPITVPKLEVPMGNQNILKLTVAAIEELQSQVHQPGTTAEERYKILDARDRLMRLKRSKQQNLATAKVTKGCCPDMCPEKERYMREFQRQLASYEQLESSSEYKIDHHFAVKQYSRSSADQEEPMAHDLRPLKSLKMTMSYLLHEIADLCEREDANLTEWYHFLWDRMRSIRKDITQQELCCLETVELVEQCARFHILSSERLCAEEASVFDPKINSENLTKCLQTLKYMYHDLREDGITCKNEPEFRGYIILLNLNNGTFISELSTLPPSVQHSAEVKFALDVHSAIAMNNYVKFFKLVRKTTYLNGCILLRYFNQVRLKALKVMVKAYCRVSGTAEYPLYELIDILGFEDEDEVSDVCERVGLICDTESMYIKLNKEKFREPDGNVEQGRALNLVQSKLRDLDQTIGQCIAGGVWPEKTYENHTPHRSFDDRGYLLPSSINAQDQSLVSDPYEFNDDNDVEFVEQKPPGKTSSLGEIKKPDNAIPTATPFFFKPNTDVAAAPTNKIFSAPASSDGSAMSKPAIPSIFAPASTSSIFAKPATPVFSAITTKQSVLPISSPFNMTVTKSIFSGNSQANLFKAPAPVTAFAPSPFANKAIGNDTSKFPTSTAATTTPAPNLVKVETASMPSSVTERKRRLEPEEENAGKKALTEKEELKRMQEAIERKMKAEQERLKMLERVSIQSQAEYDRLCDEVVEELCSEIARDELERLESLSAELYEEVLAEMCEEVLRDQLFIRDTLMEVESRLRERLIAKYWRAWKQWAARRRAQRREALDNTPAWLQPDSLAECARKLYQPQQQLAIRYARECRKRKARSLTELESTTSATKHAPIEFIIYVGLKENAKTLEAEPCEHYFWKMVVSWPLLENRLVLWRHKRLVNKYLSPSDHTLEPITIRHKPSALENLDICIRYFEGLISENCLTGMDALLFIVGADEDESQVERRLTKAVLSREKLMPIPLVVLVFGDGVQTLKTIKTSVIEKLLESGYVSKYSVLYEQSIDEDVVLRIFQSATLWLAINRSRAVPLEMDYLRKIFDDCLHEELWLRIQHHFSSNAKLLKALDDANFVINLYNEAVTNATDIILNPESLRYTDFAPELKIYVANKRTYPCTYEYFDAVWKHPEYRVELERIMNSFIFPPWNDDWPIRDTMEAYDAIADYCRQMVPYEISLSVTNNIMSDMYAVINSNEDKCPCFTDVLLHIVSEKIKDIGGNARVVYNKYHVKDFRTLPWFFQSSTLLDYMEQNKEEEEELEKDEIVEYESESLNVTASESQISMDFECDIDKLNETCQLQEEEQPIEEICRETRYNLADIQNTAEQFEKQMEEQRLRSESLEEKIRKALEDGGLSFMDS